MRGEVTEPLVLSMYWVCVRVCVCVTAHTQVPCQWGSVCSDFSLRARLCSGIDPLITEGRVSAAGGAGRDWLSSHRCQRREKTWAVSPHSTGPRNAACLCWRLTLSRARTSRGPRSAQGAACGRTWGMLGNGIRRLGSLFCTLPQSFICI